MLYKLYAAAALGLCLMACGPQDDEDKAASADLDGDGYALDDGDCDDDDAAINPGVADTVGDGIDNDCDGVDGADADADGHASEASGGDDCDDNDAGVNPSLDEVPYDGIDQDCSGADLIDVDADGFDATEVGGPDCDDNDGAVNPDAQDTVGNGVDDNCDGVDGRDDDGDGSASLASGGDDCRDGDADIHPGADEVWYDGIDQDCGGDCDHDQDGDGAVIDGYVVTDGSPCDTDPDAEEIGFRWDCDDADATVSNRLAALSPPDGALGVVFPTPISATFDAVEVGATLELTQGGLAVAGSAAWVDTALVFTPDAPLVAALQYEATTTWSCGSQTWSFTPAERAPIDPASLVGNTYAFATVDGVWLEPPGIGDLMSSIYEVDYQLGVVDATDTELHLMRALSTTDPFEQDVCFETLDYGMVDFSYNPGFSIVAYDIEFVWDDVLVPFQYFELTGRFASDGSRVEDAVLAVDLDTRPMVEFVAPGGDDDAVCELVATFGVDCLACPDGTGQYCLEVRVESIPASLVPGLTLEERTTEDIDADPICN